ncbi:MAG: hypothetical protein KA314_13560 [Chloroflexi bacterium]|nr:hypothetical protein [Chloroflexota bacterium]
MFRGQAHGQGAYAPGVRPLSRFSLATGFPTGQATTAPLLAFPTPHAGHRQANAPDAFSFLTPPPTPAIRNRLPCGACLAASPPGLSGTRQR